MPQIITRIIKILLVSLIPLLLILGSARLLATDAYLRFEYGKTSFPPDAYGFTPQQRFELASTNIHYVRAHLPDETLAIQSVEGVPLYTSREVSHMEDVQSVFQAILRLWQGAFVVLLLLAVILWQNDERMDLATAIKSGGLLTSGMIVGIAILAIFAWKFWFNVFHLFFFQPGSWLFSYSDTLIRLFPVQFWFDSTLTISVLSLLGGLAATLLGRYWQRTLREAPQTLVL
jgi:integral membrane protein (TIGR01906 family)